MRKKTISGIIMAIGFLLSPLSWWNDVFINLPLAYLGGVFASLVFKDWFFPGVLVTYWLTNILGFLMIHFGVNGLTLREGETQRFHKKEIIVYLVATIVYTLAIFVLFKRGIVKLPWEYFMGG
ncbi:MAG: hypothetical protein A2418_01560 [Candidatus Brennerbacteria bacterium RIFOXYC1_FULL_41_11]|uniref:Uncharacterized protein n=1 Tax=Candidatus Brennerbacteria bacterium RIFOXYD1_FULL_41_16 TaxID=1797529 RepID=A0A1G1XIU5_9BACT|nr:MAG: hypothetical protein A2418_01560 [Candidatus Brennerbacteria bacterium RIFOXYC1_FULL_41_11]OGY39368.1 MAG: hypothetical protein A2391_02750 [Candidatus Brennerbacteria bacterium RIFOXYB1_FULL_41_13]OGY39995.1 MAG: hypothetical protein A2570_00700 [Candidatus Brennerbacteria bacterium RIFOXYD1_FULL_41_16]